MISVRGYKRIKGQKGVVLLLRDVWYSVLVNFMCMFMLMFGRAKICVVEVYDHIKGDDGERESIWNDLMLWVGLLISINCV